MKPRLAFSGLFIAFSSILSAQEEEVRDPNLETDAPTVTIALRAPAELDQMLAPLALYPDPLIALILPASTFPSDVVLAARYLAANPNASAFDEQSWDDSVKGLAHYPEVLRWMDENLAWTKQLGEAFGQQPADVMNAMQRLRAKARSTGSLVDTPQQTVVTQGEEIRILPTSTEVIYVPRYDPAVVYVESPYYYYPRPALTFSVGFAIGSWMAYDCDWGRRTVWYVRHDHRPQVWREHCAVGYLGYANQPRRYSEPYWRAWRPSVAVRVSTGRFAEQRSDYRFAGRTNYSANSASTSQGNTSIGENRRESERRNNWHPNESRQRSASNPSYAYSGGRNYSETSPTRTVPTVVTPPSAPAARSVSGTRDRPATIDATRPNRYTPPVADRGSNYTNRPTGDFAGRSRDPRPPTSNVSTPPPAPSTRSYTPPRAQPPPQASDSSSSTQSQGQSRGASWQGKMAEAAKTRSESGRR